MRMIDVILTKQSSKATLHDVYTVLFLPLDGTLDSTEELIREGERLERRFKEKPQAEVQVIIMKIRSWCLKQENSTSPLPFDVHLLCSHCLCFEIGLSSAGRSTCHVRFKREFLILCIAILNKCILICVCQSHFHVEHLLTIPWVCSWCGAGIEFSSGALDSWLEGHGFCCTQSTGKVKEQNAFFEDNTRQYTSLLYICRLQVRNVKTVIVYENSENSELIYYM